VGQAAQHQEGHDVGDRMTAKWESVDVTRRRMLATSGLAALAASFWSRRVQAHDHTHHNHDASALPKDVRRSELQVTVPELTLVRQDGAKVAFPRELDDGAPVLLTFIYTSCTTVCPVVSKVFSDLQPALGRDLERAKMVSISIDPEYDTPARLTEYARRFGANPRWQHYTGTVAASVAMQKAFNAYRGDKMSHTPVTFLRAAPGKAWVRYDGFASATLLAKEYKSLTARA
jgi:protein SCO1/2